jgi:A/G-specific adenine glycosylase
MAARTASETPAIFPELRIALQGALLTWYDRHKRDLPWRRSRDAYAIWVSEAMLQQTQVGTVISYYGRFLDRFPDIAALAAAPLQSVLRLWEGLGYYSRARHLHRSAQIVNDTHGGTLPEKYEQLRALPGIGDYIAAAVASIAFGGPHAVVDGNVKRVLARLFRISVPANTPAGHRLFQETATALLDSKRPGDYNQAVMELGALICTPRRPQCRQCPLAMHCGASAGGQVEHFPQRMKKAPLPVQRVAAVQLVRNGRILLAQRPAQGLLAGLWELPCGPVLPGEEPEAALRQHLRALFGLELEALGQVGTVRHTYTHFKLEMMVFRGSGRGNLRRGNPITMQWVPPERLDELPLHKATLKALALLNYESGRSR